jgi:3-hydroxyacyl-CoA dehydrogenase
MLLFSQRIERQTGGIQVNRMEADQFRDDLSSSDGGVRAGGTAGRLHLRLDAGTGKAVATPSTIRSVSVIGAGLMGQGIAAAALEHYLPVTMADTSSDIVTTGIAKVLQQVARIDFVGDAQRDGSIDRRSLLHASLSPDDLANSDLIVEAVVEKLAVKRRIFAQLEPLLNETSILASNTSSIPITDIGARLAHPERLCGMHFCHPVDKRRLVEVIPGERTDAGTIARAVEYVGALGKLPIVVKDAPGFLVNRLLMPYLNEAVELVLEGADVDSVEAAAVAYGFPVGPIRQLDAIGIDVALRVGLTLYKAFPDRVTQSELLPTLYESGCWGEKSGNGFFCYDQLTGSPTRNREVDELIRHQRRARKQFSSTELTMRLLLPMLVEATSLLEEEVVATVGDVDVALINGIGFPVSKGGLLSWADTLGAENVLESLAHFRPLGVRYEPTKMLRTMAESGSTFYPK